MATFFYTALDKANNFVKGKIEANNFKKAKEQLESGGFLIVNIKLEKKQRFENIKTFFSGVSRVDLIFFTRHLFTMLEAGIALDQAVNITAEQVTSRKFKEVLEDIYKRLQKGQPFHHCLAQHPRYFSKFYVSIIKVGEKSGKLHEVFSHLLEQQESDYELVTRARSAMVYPSVIVCALIVMVTFMMIFVIPKVTGILSEYKVQLPLATRILMGLSYFIIHWGWTLIPVIIALVFIIRKILRTPKGKWRWDTLVLKIPRLNKIIIEFNLARFARALCVLLKSGVPFDQAIELTADVSSNSHYTKALKSGIGFIQRGVNLTEVLAAYPKLFPPITSRMIGVGEKTGKLDHMLHKLATFYEKSVNTSVGNLASVIEPVLLLCIGFTVAFVAISVLTPIWKFSATVQ